MSFDNPIVQLGLKIQNLAGQNIVTEFVSKTGPDHEPIVTMAVILPDGQRFEASGPNKRKAKQNAAEFALAKMMAEEEE